MNGGLKRLFGGISNTTEHQNHQKPSIVHLKRSDIVLVSEYNGL